MAPSLLSKRGRERTSDARLKIRLRARLTLEIYICILLTSFSRSVPKVASGPVGGLEQKHFSPLGAKLYFHENFSSKISIVLTPNMAALSRGCKPRIVALTNHGATGTE